MNERQGPIPDSYWVAPGRLLAGEYPGDASDGAAEARLPLFRTAGIDSFIDLTEAGEYHLSPYAELAGELGMRHSRHPIKDLGTPAVDEMRAILDEIDAESAAGRMVYVHCYGGIGRTGTAVGCLLVRHGMTADDALASIVRWREGTPKAYRESPETRAQRAFVRAWVEGQ